MDVKDIERKVGEILSKYQVEQSNFKDTYSSSTPVMVGNSVREPDASTLATVIAMELERAGYVVGFPVDLRPEKEITSYAKTIASSLGRKKEYGFVVHERVQEDNSEENAESQNNDERKRPTAYYISVADTDSTSPGKTSVVIKISEIPSLD